MTTKTVYQTNPLGVYVGPVQADESPLEPGVYLVPGGCVTEPPPLAPELKAPRWNGKSWDIIDYLDGLQVYHTVSGQPTTLQGSEPMPAGYTMKKPGPGQIWKRGRWVDDQATILADHQRIQLDAITANCAAYIVSGFSSDALGEQHRYDSAIEDQVNLLSAVFSAMDGLCTCADPDGVKKLRAHTVAQLHTVSQHFSAFRQAALQQAEQLKAAVADAVANKDLKALQAITWTQPL